MLFFNININIHYCFLSGSSGLGFSLEKGNIHNLFRVCFMVGNFLYFYFSYAMLF